MAGKTINKKGWAKYSTWENSRSLRELYARRCRLEAEEMTCHQQALELLMPHMEKGDTLLDVGCGGGYFYHSLRKRNILAAYFGIDAAASLIKIGKKVMPSYGLPAENLQLMRIEDLNESFDHIVCINVLTYLDNYPRYLERMLKCARKTVVLRESIKEIPEYLYVVDKYLDGDVELKVHINAYPRMELKTFIESYCFSVEFAEDRFSGGKPQMVIDYPHYWEFLIARKNTG